MTNFDYDAHIKNQQIKANLTPEQLQELKDLYVERLVDNMSVKDLVAYVTDDMTQFVDKQSPLEFFDDAYNYWDDYFDEIVEEIKGGQFENDLHQRKLMKTIKLTDDQFETLFHFVDERVEDIVDRSVQFQDSEILEDWEDLFDVHTILESVAAKV